MILPGVAPGQWHRSREDGPVQCPPAPMSSPLGGRCAVLSAVALPTQLVSRGVLVCGANSHRDPLWVRAWARCSRCYATSTSEHAASRAACEWAFRRSLSQRRPCLPQDLCERHEKGVLHKQQRALHKYTLMKRQMSTALHGREPESVEQLESRIVEVLGAGHRAVAWVLSPGGLATPGSAGSRSWSRTAAALGVPSAPLDAWLGCVAVTQREGWSPGVPEDSSVLAVTVHQAGSKGTSLLCSRRTRSRRWSSGTTSPCTACTRRCSWCTRTCPSPPTSWAPSSTPRSKGTRRWGPLPLPPRPAPLSLRCRSCKPGSPHKRP